MTGSGDGRFPLRHGSLTSLGPYTRPQKKAAMWKRPLALLLLLPALLLGRSTAGQAPSAITTPAELWRGYDREALPLDVRVIRTWTEDGCAYEKLTFTGEAGTRIFALRGAPEKGKRLPGVLHIHGGGQTASPEWVRYWARRGYVAVSFDFCGPLPGRAEFTDWGPIPHANMAQAAGGFQVRPTPRESSWYHWAVASRRALTLLARHPRVNPKRLGIFGVSVGGTLCWLVAATDPRVRTAVPIYGCGYNHDDRNLRWGFGPLSPDLRIYKAVLSPEAHAPAVRCPVLFLSATNDFHGPLDYSFDTLRAVRGPARQAFTPRYNHHLEPEQGGDLPRWMAWQLRGEASFPATPELRLALNPDGDPAGLIRPDRQDEVTRVDVLYSLRDRLPQARFWRRVEATRTGREWRAALPVMDPGDLLFAFANVTYRSGVSLSSTLLRETPRQLGPARATLQWSPIQEHGRDGLEGWFYTAAYTDPNVDWTLLKVERDTPGGASLTLNGDRFGDPMDFSLSTHLLNDPQWEGRPGHSLAFDCRGAYAAGGLTVNLITHDWRPTTRTYTAQIASDTLKPGWNHVHLPLARFTAPDGERLLAWPGVERLELKGRAARQAPPAFRNFRWEAHSP